MYTGAFARYSEYRIHFFLMVSSGHLRFFPKTHIFAALCLLIIVSLVLVAGRSGERKREISTITVGSEQLQQTTQPTPRPDEKWEETQVKSGDSLSVLFTRNNLSSADALAIAKAAPKEALRLHPGQTVKWQRTINDQVAKMRIESSPLIAYQFNRKTDDTFEYSLDERVADRRPVFASATINSSLFEDGGAQNIPESVLIELAHLFGWDIDFVQDIRQGDQFSLIYEELFLDGKRIGYGNILIAEFINQGKEYTAVRYDKENGDAQYYAPDGSSMRKEFLRNPIDFARISSRFNLRRKHPVLNKIRAHRGTDYAAPRGTPIKSTGDGKVIFAGRKGGFGNCVIIQHGSRYQTLYAHLSKFSKYSRRGRKVRQGQVIGYVGSTGLATGPHLHYEFRVDGVHRDSLRIRLPKSRSIESSEKQSFLQHADRMIEVDEQLRNNTFS